jgi:hypothetical protein
MVGPPRSEGVRPMVHPLSAKDLPRSRFRGAQSIYVPLLLLAAAAAIAGALFANPAAAASTTGVYSAQPVYLFGIPVDFILFGLTLLGVAVFHHKTLEVALTGLAAVTVYKLLFTGFRQGAGFNGLVLQLHHEWVIFANLFLLLMGFAILSRHFEKSRIPDAMPAYLPDGWSGGLALLAIVFVLSSFLDNIAAALIGGTMARHVFKGKVHIGYLAAIVAAANAGGAGSVVGDTTTTMMWIDGISPLRVVEALYRCRRGLPSLRHSRVARTAPAFADQKGCAARPAYRMGLCEDCRCNPVDRHWGERRRKPEVSGTARFPPGDRTCSVDRHPRNRAAASARLGNHARNV